MAINCKNCNASFEGKFCNLCGEKVVEQSDFEIKSIIQRGIGAIFNFDSKFFKTFKLLFLKPGELTKNFVSGRRVPYMKPFQIFVIANIVFFLFLSDIDIFRSPSHWYIYAENTEVMEKVKVMMDNENWTLEEVKNRYDKMSSDLAKGLLIIFIPFLGLIGMLFHWRSKISFGKHLIFAIHFFSFFLFLCVMWTESVKLILSGFGRFSAIIPINILMLAYYVLGLRNFYKDSWAWAISKGVASVILFGALIQIYRILINIISLDLIS